MQSGKRAILLWGIFLASGMIVVAASYQDVELAGKKWDERNQRVHTPGDLCVDFGPNGDSSSAGQTAPEIFDEATAFEALLNAHIVAFGPVSYAATIPPELQAWNAIYLGPNAEAHFRELAHHPDNPEAMAYGYVGLAHLARDRGEEVPPLPAEVANIPVNYMEGCDGISNYPLGEAVEAGVRYNPLGCCTTGSRTTF